MGAVQRRQRDREKRRLEILDAARTVLFRDGMNAVSMNKIADAAEVSVGTLYLYFESKEELFAALQEEGLDLLGAMIARAAAGDDPPAARLHRMAEAYREFSETHRKYFDIYNFFLTSPEVSFPADLKSRIDTHGAGVLAIVENVLRDAGAPAPREGALVFWSTLHGLLQFRKLRDTILAGQDFRRLYEHGIQCLLRSLTPAENASTPA